MKNPRSNITPIFVSGLPRSGSTWLGTMLAFDEKIQYLHEPFHPRATRVGNPFHGFFQYLPPQKSLDDYPAVSSYFEKVISFKGRGLFDVGDWKNSKKIGFFLQPLLAVFWSYQKKIPLIKDPPALLAAEWLYHHYDLKMIFIIRHPAAMINSFLKVNWGRFGMSTFLNQPELMERHLSHYTSFLEKDVAGETSLIENNCLFWVVMNHMIYYYKQSNSDWIFVRHEDLSIDPVNQFRQLYDKLGLSFTERIEEKITNSTKGVQKSRLVRDSKKVNLEWKQSLSVKDIQTIYELTKPVSSKFYSDDEW